jgi:glc operon protein GlcG
MNRRFVVRTLAILAMIIPEICRAQDDPGAAEPGSGSAPLIERGAIKLTLGGAQEILDGAQEKAKSMGLKVNITVVDEGGHPIAFVRMDGARSASSYTSMTKAVAAATLRQPTGPLPPGVDQPDALLNLSIQLTASASGGRVTTLYGGVPVVVEGQIIGAVGVGGATGEQDAEIARAGIARLLGAIEPDEDPEDGR